jgi:hypothetical protein
MGISLEQLPEFKKAYIKAKKMKWETFDFHGEEVLTSYAKYAVQYLESQKNKE